VTSPDRTGLGYRSESLAINAVDLPDLYRLRAFVVLAGELNFRRAAERLNMTQSPLSRVVKKLEDELGVALFDRSRRRVALTPAGQCIVPLAQSLLDSAARLLAEARNLQQAHGDELGDRRRLNRQTMEGPEHRLSGVRHAARFNMSKSTSDTDAKRSK
jgi:DNA-binding MarR family transcriptional regulator